MKFIPLIWAGLWRRRGRTWINLVSILVAFALFGILQGLATLFGGVGGEIHADQLIVLSKNGGFGGVLPLTYANRIAQIPHVRAVNYRCVFVGIYQKPPQFAVGFAVDPNNFFATTREYRATDRAVADLVANRQGALVSTPLLKKYGWKIGDRVVLKDPTDSLAGDGAGNWSFIIVGSFAILDNAPGDGPFVFNYDYYDHGRTQNKGMMSSLDVFIDSIAQVDAVIRTIDNSFANSPYETLTQPFSTAIQNSLKQLVDIDYVAHLVLSVVFFSLLISVGSVLMRNVRERTPELALLESLGYSGRTVALLLLSENFVLSLTGACLGLGIASAVMSNVIKLLNLNYQGIPVVVMEEATIVAVLFALLSGVPPVWRALHLEIAEALGGR